MFLISVSPPGGYVVCCQVFKYDTVHGTYDGTVENDDSSLFVDGKKIKVSLTTRISTRLSLWVGSDMTAALI